LPWTLTTLTTTIRSRQGLIPAVISVATSLVHEVANPLLGSELNRILGT
jgi:hypothetical protein